MLPCVLLHKVVFPLNAPFSRVLGAIQTCSIFLLKRLYYRNCMTAIFVLVTNFWIRWQKTDIKPKGLPALQTKKGRRFVVKLLPFVHTAMWVLHTVFISECFQLVVPAMIFVETFALPQPIGNEIASVTNFRIRWQKTDTKPKGLVALQTKKRQTFCCQTPAFCTHCNVDLHVSLYACRECCPRRQPTQ